MTDSQTTSSPWRRRARWLIFGVAIVGLVPTFLTLTGKHSVIVKFVNPGLASALEYKAISTHWWSPVQITDVRIRDLSAQHDDASSDPIPLATARSIKTIQPLWKLALSRGDAVELVIQRPVLNLSVHEGETNLEQTMARIWGPESHGGESTRFAVTIEDGTVRIPEHHNGQVRSSPKEIRGIHGRVSTLASSAALPEVAFVADIGHQKSSLATNKRPGNRTQIAATLDEISADHVLLPFDEQSQTESPEDASEPSLKVYLGPSDDDSNHHLTVDARRIDLTDLEPLIQRLVPQAACRGTLSCRLQARFVNGQLQQGIAGRFQLSGENVRWRQSTWADGESLDLRNVTAQGAMALAEDGVLVKDLRVDSGVISLTGDGEVKYRANEPTAAMARAGASHSQQHQQAVADAEAAAAGQVRISGLIDVAAVSQMIPKTMSIAEGVAVRKSELKFSARIFQSPVRQQAGIPMARSRDGFHWQLAAIASPISATRDGRTITVKSMSRLDGSGAINLSGATVDDVVLKGSFGELSAEPTESGYLIDGDISPERLWEDLRGIVNVPRPGLRGNLVFSGHVKSGPDSFEVSDLSLKSSGLTASSEKLNIYPSRSALSMFDGSFDVRGDSRAVRSLIAPWHAATWLSDASTVAARLSADPQQQILVQAVVRNPARSNSSEFLVVDEGRLDASLIADPKTGGFLVDKGVIEVPGLRATVSGTLGVREGLLSVNLDADTEYQLDSLTRGMLNVSDSIVLRGQGREVFHIQGSPSIWSAADLARHRQLTVAPADDVSAEPLHVTGTVAWHGGQLYGMDLGPGRVVAELKEGLLRSEPIRCVLGGGDLNVMPQWNLVSNRIQLASGSRISDLQLTPELTQQWLSYVAPVMSDAANIDGRISARLQQFDYSVDYPSRTSIDAVLTVHDGSARAGNSLGPLLQVLSVLGKDRSGGRRLTFPAQTIPIQVKDGMVRHEGLQLDLNGYVMRSGGVVGMNQQVKLMLDVPLAKSSAQRNGRAIRVPIEGTVRRPRLNVAGLLQNAGRQQIEERVNQEIDRGLNKLLDRLR